MTLRLPDTGANVLPDGRRLTPSAERNAGPILALLQAQGAGGRLLELASGSGLHAARMAPELPRLTEWQPSDADPANFASITAWAAQAADAPIRPPMVLDATTPGLAARHGPRDTLLLVNLLHLIPTDGAATLLAEVALSLAPGGTAFLYGPFLRDGQPTSTGDVAFDASLRAQNPLIGYKDLAWVQARLTAAGLSVTPHDMPANNLMLVARR